ncbi:MAG: putative hydroxymethylpyrimidine transport system substrate-binding protein [Solirubrobacteraceae bacterium]|jgi:putative hydroxymethylpyrimidine transport system substrate-binding protein|nr:putative hydroxymethylpyrimidine transport system substrate-binding protein [Solirubrobacteraceae bacterium]
MRRLAPLLAALTLTVAACGTKKDPVTPASADRLTVMLDFFPNADHGALYAAQAAGDFRQAALNVRIQTPPDPATPLKLLLARKVDLAVSYEPELLLARDKGAPLVAVGALVQRPLTSIIALDSTKIHNPGDLRGKKVGTAGIPYQAAYLKTILARAHVDPHTVHEVNVGFDLVPAMLTKRVDATLGGYWNYEAIQLAQKRKRATVIRVDQAGVPTYDELVLVARRDFLAAQGGKVRRFVQALARGDAALRRDPKPALDALVRANPQASRGLQEASLRATLPAFAPPPGKPYGYLDPVRWAAYGEWMQSNRLLHRPPRAETALTDEFLAGQGG